MNESRLAELFPVLDRVVYERLKDGSFRLVTSPPGWLAEMVGRRGERTALLAALPFLESFVGEAEAFWWHGNEGAVWSGTFVAGAAGGQHLLRAAAVTLWTSHLLVVERLTGDADTRPLLQAAREHALERERLRGRVESLRKPTSTITAAASQLLTTDLSPAQRELVERIAGAAERILALM